VAIKRSKNEFSDDALIYKGQIENPDEWKDSESASRIDEESWIVRYEYESNLVSELCRDNNFKKILEFGSGPGKFADMVQKKIDHNVSYTMIDKQYAKELFEKNKFKGKFLVKDLMNYVDTSDLDDNYDLIIANDFLEHIANPSNILSESYKITKDKAMFFVSVPNWRMGHTFIYRGLFDYDNIIYTLQIHGWDPTSIWVSPIEVPSSWKKIPKLSSEEYLPDELLLSWNWYIGCDKI
jgi:2-polyprenyl-3-methyl-5-hydroxy-6-metoxy-1,4-benzoquinol methylase